MAPIVWRLPALDVPLPKDGKVIEALYNVKATGHVARVMKGLN